MMPLRLFLVAALGVAWCLGMLIGGHGTPWIAWSCLAVNGIVMAYAVWLGLMRGRQ